ncbi:peptidase inhibitor family I36 protein [Actinomyces faecalis]|uniref:peptidase inhibitor family I36 protein n=1 Tax=Actinomyces faecalis TaxID=2722820 RepID=UPI0015531ADB|nr:peptidase inhibitor family I36 protein [Actinomyces faecalis]
MLKKMASIVASVLLAAGALVLPSAAQAAQGDCGSGYTCLWEHDQYQGGGISFERYIPDLSQWKLTNGHGANDALSSVWNNGVYADACLFDNAYATGQRTRIPRGTWYGSLRPFGMNDKVSSVYFETYLPGGGWC